MPDRGASIIAPSILDELGYNPSQGEAITYGCFAIPADTTFGRTCLSFSLVLTSIDPAPSATAPVTNTHGTLDINMPVANSLFQGVSENVHVTF